MRKGLRQTDIHRIFAIEVYPFIGRDDATNPYPEEDDFEKTRGPSHILTSRSAEITRSLLDKFGTKKYKGRITEGLKNLSYTDTKMSPAANLSFNFVGPVPETLVPGSWVVVTSFSKLNKTLIRKVEFVGQIRRFSPSYSISKEGQIYLSTNFQVSEWSYILNSPLRFDARSLINELVSQGERGVSSATKTVKNLVGKTDKLAADVIDKALTSVFDPFEIAQLCLSLSGAISSIDTFSSVGDVTDVSWSGLAISPPKVPVGLLQRLLVGDTTQAGRFDDIGSFNKAMSKSTGTDFSRNPYQSGFVKVVSGIPQENPFSGYENWRGIFRIDQFKKYTDGHIERFRKAQGTRPGAPGASFIMQSDFSVWSILNNYCDSTFNEFYTSYWYVYADATKVKGVAETVELIADKTDSIPDLAGSDPEVKVIDVVAKPVLVMRSKPFILKKLLKEDLKPQIYPKVRSTINDFWPTFDSIPRVRLPDGLIKSLQVDLSIEDSPNYFVPDYQNSGIEGKASLFKGSVNSFIRLDDEMNRHGGKMMMASTRFSSQTEQSQVDIDVWLASMTELCRLWHGYTYRMPNMTLTVRDNGTNPIGVGFNLVFVFGDNAYVGHVVSRSVQGAINGENGSFETMTNVSLTRCVMLKSGKLDFIPPSILGNLVHAPRQDEEKEINPNTFGLR